MAAPITKTYGLAARIAGFQANNWRMEGQAVKAICRLCVEYVNVTNHLTAKPCISFARCGLFSISGTSKMTPRGGNSKTVVRTAFSNIQQHPLSEHTLCRQILTQDKGTFSRNALLCNKVFTVINKLDRCLSDTRCFQTRTLCEKTSNGQKRRHVDSQEKGDENKEIRENIFTVPNLLTTSRIVLTPAIGYLVVHETFSWALCLFVVAGLTDLLDGYIARNFKNQMSALGTALDPLADKILVTILTLSVTSAGLLPVPLAVIIVGRDVMLVAAAFYIRYISLPPPRSVRRYFDVTIPTAELYPSTISKINTALQLLLVSLTLAAPVFDFVNHPALQALWVVTGTTTLASGISYIITRNSNVKFLRMKRKL